MKLMNSLIAKDLLFSQMMYLKKQLKIFEALLIENDYDLSRIDFKNLHWDYNLCKYYIQ